MDNKPVWLNVDPAGKSIVTLDPYASMKPVIWAYFFLLIFEGALRKWGLSGLAGPLLVVRDPLAIWLVFTAWNRRLLLSNSYLTGMMIVGVIGILTSVLFGHGSLPVAIYGARPYLIHFPVIFVIGSVLNRDDVERIGKVVLYISIGMAGVIALQFYSPQSAWVNRGVGGDMEGSGFSGALGFFRPSGTFSFTNGITLFYSLTSCFIFYFWLKPNSNVSRILLIAATVSLLASIPLSISRGLFFSVVITILFVLFTILRNPRLLSGILIAGFAFLLVLVLLSQTSTFQTATSVFFARFENASVSEGGLQGTLIGRYAGEFLKAFYFDTDMPIFGYGLGILSNVGTALLSGNVVRGISEGEWSRGIYELGIIMGLIIIIIRTSFSFTVAVKSYTRLSKGDTLPWILLSCFLLNIPQGNWSQPTALGFSVLIGGLLIASFNVEKL